MSVETLSGTFLVISGPLEVREFVESHPYGPIILPKRSALSQTATKVMEMFHTTLIHSQQTWWDAFRHISGYFGPAGSEIVR